MLDYTYRRIYYMHRLGGIRDIFIVGVVTLIFVSIFNSCANLRSIKREITPADSALTLNKKSPYLKAHMKNGQVYILHAWSVDSTNSLVDGSGILYNINRAPLQKGNFKIGLDSVSVFETNTLYQPGSVLALSVITGISVAITVACAANPKACFGSCPTFYVTDGQKPVLQAEGFSSSIAPSLEATDVDALYRARPKGKTVDVEMRNEALETHVVRYVNLLAAVKPKNERVFKDEIGNYWKADKILSPDSCTGPEGNILEKVSSFDGNERYSLADSAYLGTKEHLDLWFDHAPKGKSGVVIASRQTLLSTYLLYQALAYMGNDIGQWFRKLNMENDPSSPKSSLSGMLGKIDVMVQDSSGNWEQVGTAGEHGPLATDVYLVPLPEVHKKGPLHVRLEMTKGDWRIDYLALAGLDGKVKPLRIHPSIVLKKGKSDKKAFLALTDSARTLITLPGDSYTLRYQLPDSARHYELFLESHGYYLEWMRKEWEHEENHQKLVQLMFSPMTMLMDLAPAYKKVEPHMEEQFWNSRYAHPFK